MKKKEPQQRIKVIKKLTRDYRTEKYSKWNKKKKKKTCWKGSNSKAEMTEVRINKMTDK